MYLEVNQIQTSLQLGQESNSDKSPIRRTVRFLPGVCCQYIKWYIFSAVCTIPTTLYNVGYSDTTGEKKGGDSVAVGKSLTMSCSEGYIYLNANTKEIECATVDTVYPIECYSK